MHRASRNRAASSPARPEVGWKAGSDVLGAGDSRRRPEGKVNRFGAKCQSALPVMRGREASGGSGPGTGMGMMANRTREDTEGERRGATRGGSGDRRGDKEWVVELQQAQRERAEAWMVSQGHPWEDARDVFCEALQSCLRLEERPENAQAYLGSQLRNLRDRYLRDQKPRQAATSSLTEDLFDDVPSLFEEVARRECREHMEADLAELSPRRRGVGRLLLDGWSVPEIARELGIAPSTVRRDRRAVFEAWEDAGELKAHLDGS